MEDPHRLPCFQQTIWLCGRGGRRPCVLTNMTFSIVQKETKTTQLMPVLTNMGINKTRYANTLEYVVMEKNEVLIHAAMPLNLKILC